MPPRQRTKTKPEPDTSETTSSYHTASTGPIERARLRIAGMATPMSDRAAFAARVRRLIRKDPNHPLRFFEKTGELGRGVYGRAYVMESRDKSRWAPLRVAVKTTVSSPDAIEEARFYQRLQRLIRKHVSPHFPFVYFANLTEAPEVRVALPKRNSSARSFHTAASTLRMSLTQDDSHEVVIFSELASGSLKEWLKGEGGSSHEMLSAFAQVFMGCIALGTEGLRHNDLHTGNVLWHETPDQMGKYYHHRAGPLDIHVRNLGKLWVLWDFGMMKEVSLRDRFYLPLDAEVLDMLRLLHAVYGFHADRLPARVLRMVKAAIVLLQNPTAAPSLLQGFLWLVSHGYFHGVVHLGPGLDQSAIVGSLPYVLPTSAVEAAARIPDSGIKPATVDRWVREHNWDAYGRRS